MSYTHISISAAADRLYGILQEIRIGCIPHCNVYVCMAQEGVQLTNQSAAVVQIWILGYRYWYGAVYPGIVWYHFGRHSRHSRHQQEGVE